MVGYDRGAYGENSRLIFRNEITSYDYERQIVYPTQKTQGDQLQSTMDAFVYGSHETLLSRAEIGNSMGQKTIVSVITSNELVSKITDIYQFAW